MIHRHLELEPGITIREMPLAAIQDLLERGDLSDWRPLLRLIAEEPDGELTARVARLVDVYPMYGTSQLVRAWIERCRNRAARPAVPRSSLAGLRASFGKTQVEVAREMGLTQSDYSKLERRRDVKVSTLRAAAGALGGRLVLLIEFPERSFEIELDS
jgi:hypothetical protein